MLLLNFLTKVVSVDCLKLLNKIDNRKKNIEPLKMVDGSHHINFINLEFHNNILSLTFTKKGRSQFYVKM